MTTTDTDLSERLKAATDEGLNAQIAEMVAPLLASRDQLVALRGELKGKIGAVDSQIVTVDRMLKAAGHIPTKKKAAASTTPKPSPAAIERTVRFLAGAERPLMTQEVAEGLSVTPSSAQKQLKIAKDVGIVRVAGRGGTTGRALLYDVMPDTIERLDAGDVRWP